MQVAERDKKKLQAVGAKQVSIVTLRRECSLERQKNVKLASDKRKLTEELAQTIKAKDVAVKRCFNIEQYVELHMIFVN